MSCDLTRRSGNDLRDCMFFLSDIECQTALDTVIILELLGYFQYNTGIPFDGKLISTQGSSLEICLSSESTVSRFLGPLFLTIN